MTLNLSIKNVPLPIVEKIREHAKKHHRSLQGELLSILEETVAAKNLTIEQVYLTLKATGLKTGSESTAMVRQDRDAR